MEKSSELTLKNRTGLQLSPQRARELLETVQGIDCAAAAEHGHALAVARSSFIAEAEPLGTLPAPATLRGVLKAPRSWPDFETLGADPTVETPSADVVGIASMGLLQIVSDPRTSITQSLQAALAAELIDREGWELLVSMADELGERDMVAQFRDALKEENEHLLAARRWYFALSLAASGAD